MKYKSKARFKMLLQVGVNEVREILPNEIFESAIPLNQSFLEEIKPVKKKQPIIKKIKDPVNGSNSTSA